MEQRTKQIQEQAHNRYYMCSTENNFGWPDLMEAFIAGARYADTYPCWIKVADSLPDTQEDVLGVFMYSEDVLVAYTNQYRHVEYGLGYLKQYKDGTTKWYVIGEDDDQHCNVIAWKPIDKIING